MLEEPHQMLFEYDYALGYSHLRYLRGIPCKCPFCGIWSHHVAQMKENKALIKCPMCLNVFNAKKYQSLAIRRLRKYIKTEREEKQLCP